MGFKLWVPNKNRRDKNYADDMLAIEKYATDLGSWRQYTPTLTSTGAGFNMGANPTLKGWFARLGNGTVACTAQFIFGGAGLAVGAAGNYEFGLPVQAATTALGIPNFHVGTGFSLQTGGGVATRQIAAAMLSPTSDFAVELYIGTGGAAGSTVYGPAVPKAWVSADEIRIHCVYPTLASA